MLPLSDVPPAQQEQVVCVIMAAIKYEVPANIILAIAEKEAGKPGQWVKNKNGSYDVGIMQFNTHYLHDLASFGITPDDVASDGCYSLDLAAWRIRSHLLHDHNDLWTRAANYHSRTPKYNTIYRNDLIKKATQWGQWLQSHFATYTITTSIPAPVHLQKTTTTIHSEKAVAKKVAYSQKPKHSFNNKAALQALDAVFKPRT